ncbi:MAG: hypothetical protein K2O45_10050 [Oscillospiraceae bacterium]|nr:hypothetical protein [Oscillospiraceae bacterium]
MKKSIAVLLCICALAMTAYASEAEPDYIAEYEALYGKAPAASDYASIEQYQAAYDIWISGLVPYTERRFAEWSHQKAEAEAEKAACIAAEKEAEEKTAESELPPKTVESVGSKNDISSDHADTSADIGLPDKYPVGSYISPAGNVYAADGTLLSPGITSAMEPDSAPFPGSDEDDSLLSGELDDPDGISANADVDTLALIAELVSDIATDPAVSTVEDLRPADAPVEVLTGLKALVTSIFGEYTPVTTTAVVSQTVGNDTQQYLIETVAPGAAGVDYEWVAGVLLFAIMLFCLMKLLGGVLK